jgi:hypothetical protein
MSYQVIFDFSQKAPDWSWIIYGCLFIVVGLIMTLAAKPVARSTQKPVIFVRIFGVIFTTFAIIWTSIVAFSTAPEYQYYQAIMQQHRYQVVEGPVENFVPMPREGHATEHFTVQDIPFSYSDYSITAAFNNTSSHGGPIQAGLYVQIYYTPSYPSGYDNAILRIAVKREP